MRKTWLEAAIGVGECGAESSRTAEVVEVDLRNLKGEIRFELIFVDNKM